MIIKVPLKSVMSYGVCHTVFVVGLFGVPIRKKEERTRDSYALNSNGTRRRRSEFRVDSRWTRTRNAGSGNGERST